MIHFTHTGYYAGVTFCGSTRNETDQFMHLPYNAAFLAKTLANPELCPHCLEVYNEPIDEEEDET